jgi:hypothetical protein
MSKLVHVYTGFLFVDDTPQNKLTTPSHKERKEQPNNAHHQQPCTYQIYNLGISANIERKLVTPDLKFKFADKLPLNNDLIPYIDLKEIVIGQDLVSLISLHKHVYDSFHLVLIFRLFHVFLPVKCSHSIQSNYICSVGSYREIIDLGFDPIHCTCLVHAHDHMPDPVALAWHLVKFREIQGLYTNITPLRYHASLVPQQYSSKQNKNPVN